MSFKYLNEWTTSKAWEPLLFDKGDEPDDSQSWKTVGKTKAGGGGGEEAGGYMLHQWEECKPMGWIDQEAKFSLS